jgi:hypothetical protein
MTLRIIDNKRIDLTDDEFKLYNDICKSYDKPPNIFGKDMFKDLFETDELGLIVFLKPPRTQMISMEVYMFMVSVMIHQHIGMACRNSEVLITEARQLFSNMQDSISEVQKLIEEGKEILSSIKASK